jgi:hypothetical protein
MSASGQYAVTNVSGGSPNNLVYISNNYGQTWTSTGQGLGNSTTRMAMSASGQYALIGSQSGSSQLYSSSNYGLTWTRVGPASTWTSVAMSASGQYQIAYPLENGRYCNYSSDYGQTWQQSITGPTSIFTFGLTMSASGQYACLVLANALGAYYSSNYGQTWTVASGATNMYNVCMSASGQYAVAVAATAGTNYIYYSTNYGVNWTQSSYSTSGYWYGCAMSANAQYLLAVHGSTVAVQSITPFPQQSIISQTITSQSTATTTPLNILAPSLTTGQNVGIVLGQSTTANNYATIGFQYVGSGLTTNYVGIGVTSPTTLCIAGNNYVGIGITNPQYTLDVAGTARVTGKIYNGPSYVSGASNIYSYINYLYAVSVGLWSAPGTTCTFVTFTTFSSTPCTYLISASNATATAGNATAIITIFAGSPPSAVITTLQATGQFFSNSNLNVPGFGYSTTSTTLSILIYNNGWWLQGQTVYFTMQLLSGAP